MARPGDSESGNAATSRATERTPLLSSASQDAPRDAESAGNVESEGEGGANGDGADVKPGEESEETPLHILLPTMVALFSAIILSALDGVLVTTLLAPISSSFGESQKGTWLGTSYLISTTAFCTTFGKLADVLGRRPSMLLALFFFGLGNLGCALAPTMNALIAARSVAGIGGAGVQTMGSIIMGDLVPLRKRALWQGMANIVFCVGTSGGAPLGGVISATLGWRFGFGAQVPLLCISALLVTIFVRLPASREVQAQSLGTKIQHFDLAGIATLSVAVISSQTAISFWSGEELSFFHPRVGGLLLLAVLALTSFIYIEEYVAKEPVVPFRLLHNRNFALSTLFFFLVSFSIFVMSFHMPLFLETALLLSPAQTGLRTAPCAFAISIGSISAGVYIRRFGRFKTSLNLSNCLSIVSAIMLCTWDRKSTPSWFFFVSPIPLGLGAGFASTTALIALLSSLQKADLARANGLMYLSRNLGGVMGVGVGGAITQAALRVQLMERIKGQGAQETIDYIRHNAADLINLPRHLQEHAVDSYQAAVRVAFIVAAVSLTLTLLVCLPIREMGLDRAATASTAPAEASPPPPPSSSTLEEGDMSVSEASVANASITEGVRASQVRHEQGEVRK
ncbi:MFS general substrate transporter [Microstroma glucosiphilum]|uniref:MFS general substrate transporter n=1 Tax=Pseudomicrostroma glucosiphilum TaxID=1684307 RepID=A0A316UB59_9BASI|nr:MFS general substrate transporter [Pseudomicrostroma glucosiphilum]PWN21633.1 MFS general substrate transporter [Pseudomicrostroma glucosiphilum]